MWTIIFVRKLVSPEYSGVIRTIGASGTKYNNHELQCCHLKIVVQEVFNAIA